MLRQFGSRDGLFAEAMDAAMVDAEDERRTPPGDVAAAVRIVVDHYERRGRTWRVLPMLAQEGYDDVARKATDRGKAMHRDWVARGVAPAHPTTRCPPDLLVVAERYGYTWKLLRIDRGDFRAVTERRLHQRVTRSWGDETGRGKQGALTWPRSSSSPGTAAASDTARDGHRRRVIDAAAIGSGSWGTPPSARRSRRRASTSSRPRTRVRSRPTTRSPWSRWSGCSATGVWAATRWPRWPTSADLVVVDCLLLGAMEALPP